jgi:hypothetical protein
MVQDTIKAINFPKDTVIKPVGNNFIYTVDLPVDSSGKKKKHSEKKNKVKSDIPAKDNAKSDKLVAAKKTHRKQSKPQKKQKKSR